VGVVLGGRGGAFAGVAVGGCGVVGWGGVVGVLAGGGGGVRC